MERVGLSTETAGSRAAGALEVAAKSRGKERMEDDVGATGVKTVGKLRSRTGSGSSTYRKAGRDSHRRKTNLKVK